METKGHIILLVERFYLLGFLNYDQTINLLKKNVFDSEKLTRMEIAKNIFYKQNVIKDISIDEESLRENISRVNYNKKKSIDTKVQKFIINYFNQKQFENFLELFQNCLEIYEKKDFDDAKKLQNEFNILLQEIYVKACTSWSKNNSKESQGQLRLQL